MRLVDADALIKSTDKEIVHMWEIALAPTVDAEPVVRCKDCKYWRNDDCQNDSHGYCPISENDFCSRGERREDESLVDIQSD